MGSKKDFVWFIQEFWCSGKACYISLRGLTIERWHSSWADNPKLGTI